MATPLIGGARITIRNTPYNRMLRGPDGEVFKFVAKTGGRVLVVAKKEVGVNAPRPDAPAGGKLRRSGRMVPKSRGIEVGVEIQFGRNPKLDYAFPHHQGGQPHTITPVNAQALFFWIEDPGFTEGGDFVTAKIVHHPGNESNPFLINAAKIVGLKPVRVMRTQGR